MEPFEVRGEGVFHNLRFGLNLFITILAENLRAFQLEVMRFEIVQRVQRSESFLFDQMGATHLLSRLLFDYLLVANVFATGLIIVFLLMQFIRWFGFGFCCDNSDLGRYAELYDLPLR
jgi:hypothetical protein